MLIVGTCTNIGALSFSSRMVTVTLADVLRGESPLSLAYIIKLKEVFSSLSNSTRLETCPVLGSTSKYSEYVKYVI